MLINLFVFILGSVIGSFLNVCIHRLPRGESVASPASHCPKCNKPIPWHDNIPLLSFILLSAKCRFCKEKISPRYFIVELLTASLFLGFYLYFGPTYDFFLSIVFICCLIVATFVDIAERIIPDEVSVGGGAAGFILLSLKGLEVKPFIFNPVFLLDSLLGIIAGVGIIFLITFLFDLVYFRLLKKPAIDGENTGMGLGDFKLMAMIGAFLGWEKVLLVFFTAPFFALPFGLAAMLVKKEHIIPYGPFLSLAACGSIFWADKAISLLFLR